MLDLGIMYKLSTLKNGLTLITIDRPYLDSVTTLVAVGAGSRYETKKNNGISHFLEHMFFKGSKKYPSAEIIASTVDSIGAVNNAGTDKENTFYWIKSDAKHVSLASDILSSMVKEPLLAKEEIEREKGVVTEEIRMYHDDPGSLAWELYNKLQFGDQPLGWDIAGEEETVKSITRSGLEGYIDSLYSPKNMALVYVGKLPGNIEQVATNNFSDLPSRSERKFSPFQRSTQAGPRVSVYDKKTEQSNLVLGVLAPDRYSKKRYVATVLKTILGEGMSSRLFIQIRERRGLAYSVGTIYHPHKDSGLFAVFAGLKLEKTEEGLKVIVDELGKMITDAVSQEEIKKAKEMIRGRLALRSESTNFLAEYFGVDFILDRKIETFEEYLKNIDAVTADDIRQVTDELFKRENFNLQVVGPFKSPAKFAKILNG